MYQDTGEMYSCDNHKYKVRYYKSTDIFLTVVDEEFSFSREGGRDIINTDMGLGQDIIYNGEVTPENIDQILRNKAFI